MEDIEDQELEIIEEEQDDILRQKFIEKMKKKKERKQQDKQTKKTAAKEQQSSIAEFLPDRHKDRLERAIRKVDVPEITVNAVEDKTEPELLIVEDVED